MRTPILRLAILCAVLSMLAACGAKGPLVMPTDEPAKPEQPAQ